MKTVAFVPIKLRSVRLPDKNILPLAGKPLCWHMINTLLQVDEIDEVYVYCSDDIIIQYIPDKAVFLERLESLDGDFVKGDEIYRSFINRINADIYILAHATSPFTKAISVKNALKKVLSGENDSAFAAKKIQTFAWYDGIPVNYTLENVPRTQDLKPIFVENSAFYIFRKEIFTKHNRRIGFTPYIQTVNEIEGMDTSETGAKPSEPLRRYKNTLCRPAGRDSGHYKGLLKPAVILKEYA